MPAERWARFHGNCRSVLALAGIKIPVPQAQQPGQLHGGALNGLYMTAEEKQKISDAQPVKEDPAS